MQNNQPAQPVPQPAQPAASQGMQAGNQVFPEQQNSASPQVQTTPTINAAPPPPPKKGSFLKTLFLLLFILLIVGGALAGGFAYAIANDLVQVNNPQLESLAKSIFGKSDEVNTEELVTEDVERATDINYYDLKITTESEEPVADFEVLVASESAFFRPKVFYIDFEYGFEDWISYENSDLNLLKTDLQTAFDEIDYNNLVFEFNPNTFVTPEIPEQFSEWNVFEMAFEISQETIGDNDSTRLQHLEAILDAVVNYEIADLGFLSTPECFGLAPQCFNPSKIGLTDFPIDPVTGHVQESGYMIYLDEETGKVIATATSDSGEEIRIER